MPDLVEFDEPSHTYRVNGVEYPSVSTVLGHFMDFARVPRDVLERKRQIGRATHKAIELYEADELDADTVDDDVMPFLESWIRFRTIKPLRVVATERIVYSKKHRFAGRLDLVVEFLDEPGVLWVLDGKAVYTISPATALQVAAYREAWNENEPIKIAKRGALQFKPNGAQAELYPYTDRNDFNYYLNSLNCHKWILRHG